MGRVVGYGRVSLSTQCASSQKYLIEQTLGLPVDEWYEDHAVSGTVKTYNRPCFSKMLEEAKEGDTLVFSRVDRISRTLSDIVVTVEQLLERGIEVYILQIGRVPLSDVSGFNQLVLYSMFAQNERLAISERTKSALARKKSEGIILGGKMKIPPETLEALCEERKRYTLDHLSAKYGFDRSTIQRTTSKWAGNLEGYKAKWEATLVQRT